jgi:hypothetical protein
MKSFASLSRIEQPDGHDTYYPAIKLLFLPETGYVRLVIDRLPTIRFSPHSPPKREPDRDKTHSRLTKVF